jgi:uncharacterized protein YlxP (DUF503 family)
MQKSVHHLMYQCEKLKGEREILKNSVFKTGKWPISKSELVSNNLKQLICYKIQCSWKSEITQSDVNEYLKRYL